MRRIVLALTLLLTALSAAGRQRVRNLEIELYLLPSGGVVFHERWDISTGNDITEWYLVRGNLGDIEVFNLRVFEKGQEFTDTGDQSLLIVYQGLALEIINVVIINRI